MKQVTINVLEKGDVFILEDSEGKKHKKVWGEEFRYMCQDTFRAGSNMNVSTDEPPYHKVMKIISINGNKDIKCYSYA